MEVLGGKLSMLNMAATNTYSVCFVFEFLAEDA